MNKTLPYVVDPMKLEDSTKYGKELIRISMVLTNHVFMYIKPSTLRI